MERFIDRSEAGRVLAEQLRQYSNRTNVVVLALPRGGVPVAYQIADALSLPLDVFIVRKLGVPSHKELALGAIALGGVVVFNEDIVEEFQLKKSTIDRVIQQEQVELGRRNIVYREGRPFTQLANKTIILVDDGIATGATIRAAIKALREQKPLSIILAVPVAQITVCDQLSGLVDKMICPLKPKELYAVGAWYEDFPQTTDEEVSGLLAKSKKPE